MKNPFKDNTIERRVMARVRARIESAQQKFEKHLELKEKEREQAHADIDRKHEVDRDLKVAELVDEVFGLAPR